MGKCLTSSRASKKRERVPLLPKSNPESLECPAGRRTGTRGHPPRGGVPEVHSSEDYICPLLHWTIELKITSLTYPPPRKWIRNTSVSESGQPMRMAPDTQLRTVFHPAPKAPGSELQVQKKTSGVLERYRESRMFIAVKSQMACILGKVQITKTYRTDLWLQSKFCLSF